MAASPIWVGEGLTGLVVIYTDITERKRTEEALRESEERLTKAEEIAHLGSWEMDVATGKSVWSDEFFRICGLEPGTLEPTADLGMQIIHPDDREAAAEVVRRAIEKGKRYDIEKRIVRPDGSVRWVHALGEVIFDENQNPQKLIGSFLDITDRKRAEEALKEYSEQLEEMVEERTKELREAQEQLVRREKLAVLGQLAGGVSHELRGPLGAISNAAYFLNMVLEEPDPDVKQMLEIITKEVRRSEHVIRSLLDFARTKTPVRQAVNVNHIVQEALARTTAPDNVEVVRQLGEALPTILADPDQLVQVFGNLILNGAQAMPEGGRLTVKTWQVSEEKPARSGQVAVSVSDTGVGIPEEHLAKLFEPLFTTKAKGIGLGLAVTRTLVEGHGGSIEVESPSTGLRTGEVGKGSTFTVRLPMTREEGK